MSTIIANAKVGMLGHQRSGKTCFMYGMYYGFSDFSRKLAFTLHVDDDSQDDLLRDVWEEIVNGRYPPGNDDSPVSYTFELRGTLNRPLIEISWIDYRGQALHARATDEEKRALRDQLDEADCLFLCVESKTLQSRSVEETNRIARLGALTRNLPPIPLVILLTKADEFESKGPSPAPAEDNAGLLANGPGSVPLPPVESEIEDLVRARFHPWFEQDRTIMISPVSIKESSPYFHYLPAPFAFAAYTLVRRKHAERSELLGLDDGELRKRTEGLGYYFHYFGRNTTVELREKIRSEDEALAELERKMTTLRGYFARASIFRRQERVDLDGNQRSSAR